MRTRFPPSPTGFLHVGALRTALFAWLMARKTKGTFVLRIEDTDQAREVEGATKNILETLAWVGIQPDEGVMLSFSGAIKEEGPYGPYFQSKRLDLYRTYAEELLAKGHAYHCFCTTEHLEQMRRAQQERHQAPMYDRTCFGYSKEEAGKRVAAGEKHVIRLKVPREETIEYNDKIYGHLTFKGHTIDDQVLLKSDGFPTYHLAHVVDDHLMKTDLVTRGEEWLSSLPKHLILFRDFGWEAPQYAHVPLILNTDRTKLSKRQNSVAAEEYRQKGYLPEALLNFLALLGWNPGTEQEIFSLTELIDAFSLERVQKSGAVFDIEKLNWVQGQWMRRIRGEEFAERIRPLVAEKFPAAASDPAFAARASLIQGRITFFTEAADMIAFCYEPTRLTHAEIANPKQKVSIDDVPLILKALEAALKPLSDWSIAGLQAQLDRVAAEHNWKRGQVLWVLRVSLTGRPFSPGAYEVAAALGKEETLRRLKV